MRNEADEETCAESFLLVFRAQRQIQPRLAAYGHCTAIFAIDCRHPGPERRGGGLTYTWVDPAPHKLIVDGGLGYAHEQRVLGDNLSTATIGESGVYTFAIAKNSQMSEDGHFVFSLSDGDDWRYVNILSIAAKVTTVFSLRASNTIHYVNMRSSCTQPLTCSQRLRWWRSSATDTTDNTDNTDTHCREP